MQPAHLPQVLAIERASFPEPWTPEDFRRMIGRRYPSTRGFGLVATLNAEVLAYCVYRVDRRRLVVLNLAVAAHARRQGIAETLLDALEKLAARTGRPWITADVSENSLAAQLFFRACAFRCTRIMAAERDDGRPYLDYRFQKRVVPPERPRTVEPESFMQRVARRIGWPRDEE